MSSRASSEGVASARRPPPHRNSLRARLGAALSARLSPERTRRATFFEQVTVRRLRWDQIVWLNRYLELVGKVASLLWVAFLVSAIVGVHWRAVVEDTLNSGKPVAGALALVLLLPTLAFVAARSVLGFARWRLQRELWRRDVERLRRQSGQD